MNSPSTKISLYIHIPFCSSKCKYCDFYSVSNSTYKSKEVVTEIINQLEYHLQEMNHPKISTIFIGGGTPSLLENSILKKLLSSVNRYSKDCIEWTIESNPESITEEFLSTCNSYGVTRLSIGIQSFSNEILDTLGRNANKQDIDIALDLVHRFWKGELNLDLITSIPKQNIRSLLEDLKQAISHKPDHISFYALSLEKGTLLEDEVSKGILEDLNQDEQENMWLKGVEFLKLNGYNQYEISNFTKNNPCYHNLNYWELKPYLGIGPGAVSTLINPKWEIVRINNKKSIDIFLGGQKELWGEVLEPISNCEFLEDYIIMGLRLRNGINLKLFKKIFGKSIITIISVTHNLEERDLIEVTTDSYRFTLKGYNIMNQLLIEILDSIEDIKIPKVNWFY